MLVILERSNLDIFQPDLLFHFFLQWEFVIQIASPCGLFVWLVVDASLFSEKSDAG
jgi:hypothetical protein